MAKTKKSEVNNDNLFVSPAIKPVNNATENTPKATKTKGKKEKVQPSDPILFPEPLVVNSSEGLFITPTKPKENIVPSVENKAEKAPVDGETAPKKVTRSKKSADASTIKSTPIKNKVNIPEKEHKSFLGFLNFKKNKAVANPETDNKDVITPEMHVEESNDKDSIKKFRTSVSKGLSEAELQERIDSGLTNKTQNVNSKTVRQIIVSNVVTIFNLLNIVIAIWLISVNQIINLSFMIVITVNTVIGIAQEIQAKKMIESLSLISAPVVEVIRVGKKLNIHADEIVMDDLMILTPGKQICADGVVRRGIIEVNESLLTGEADPVIKKAGSSLFSGSFVVSGECAAQVKKVGKENYIQGLMAQAKKYKKPKSDILQSLNGLIRVITFIVPIIGELLFLNLMSNYDPSAATITGVLFPDYVESVVGTTGAIVGMIPSGLFLITSFSLEYGVIKLGKYNTLVQDLYCIEILARVNVLCLDKTGTITDGTMKVRDVVDYSNPTPYNVKQIIAMMQGCLNDNNPTSNALQKKFGVNKKVKCLKSIPFSSARKFSAVSFEDANCTFILGAPEFVLGKRYSEVVKDVENYAKLGYRVLLLAHSTQLIKDNNDEFNNLTTIAIIAIEDTIRDDAVNTIDYFKKSGVLCKVISGDNPLTVSKVAKRAGIDAADNYISLDGLSDDEVVAAASKYMVFGRVTPPQKKLLISSLKANGSVVAMTGDGVNDILALKEADCSIAMANGSEAARNVSHLVLLDSNFSSMPKVVMEGRRVINNIQRVATLYLTKTLFSFLITIVAIILNQKYPIAPIQLIFFDTLIIGLPSIYLAIEPNNTQVKGRFMRNVLAKAMPGALVVLFDFLIITLLTGPLAMDGNQVSTAVVISATCLGFVVLYHVCKPFNTGRKILIALMLLFFTIGLSLSVTLLTGYIKLVVLTLPQVLLVIALVEFSIPFIKLLRKFFSRFIDE